VKIAKMTIVYSGHKLQMVSYFFSQELKLKPVRAVKNQFLNLCLQI